MTSVIHYRGQGGQDTSPEAIKLLESDTRNGPNHVFGDNANCKEYFCKGPKLGELNLVPQLQASGI